MTIDQCIHDIIEMLHLGIDDKILDACRKKLNSGTIDMEKYTSDGSLIPKIVLKAALEEIADDIEIIDSEALNLLENLRRLRSQTQISEPNI